MIRRVSLRGLILLVGATVATLPTVVAAVAAWHLERRDMRDGHVQAARAFAVAWRWHLTDPDNRRTLITSPPGAMPPWESGDQPSAWILVGDTVVHGYGPHAADPRQVLNALPPHPGIESFAVEHQIDRNNQAIVIACAGLRDIDRPLVPGALNEEPWVLVARPTRDLDAAILAKGWVMAGWAAAGLSGAGLVLFLATTLVLRPLRSVRSAIAAYSPGTGGLPGADAAMAQAPGELVPVWQALSEMSRRIDSLIARERRLVSEVAHELRTPLAGIRARLEIDSPGAETQRACHALVCTLQQLVEKLLLLTRLESGLVAISVESTPVEDLLDEVSERLGCAERRVWVLNGDAQTRVDGDYELLAVAMCNLLDNAHRHGNDPTATTVSIDREADRVYVSVTNPTNTPMPDSVLRHLSRGQPTELPDMPAASDRHGIGLALTARIMALHGGSLELDCRDESGTLVFSARLVIPVRGTVG